MKAGRKRRKDRKGKMREEDRQRLLLGGLMNGDTNDLQQSKERRG